MNEYTYICTCTEVSLCMTVSVLYNIVNLCYVKYETTLTKKNRHDEISSTEHNNRSFPQSPFHKLTISCFTNLRPLAKKYDYGNAIRTITVVTNGHYGRSKELKIKLLTNNCASALFSNERLGPRTTSLLPQQTRMIN